MKKTKRTTPQHPTTQPGADNAPLCAIDIGYGHTKIIAEGKTPIVFPSMVAPADLQAIHVGLGHQGSTVTVDHVDYIVGEQALHRGFRFTEEYDGWWTSVRYRALIQYASQYIPAGSHIVTGLPIHVFHSPAAHQQVQDVIRRGLKASQVTLLPQGVGAFIADIRHDEALNHGRVALIDIGSRTTELVAFAEGNYLHHASKGLIHGIAPLYQQLAERMRTNGTHAIDPYEVEAAYLGLRPIRLNGQQIGHEELHEQMDALVQPWLDTLWTQMSQLWGDGAPTYDRVVYCGGGAVLLGPLLTTRFRQDATVLPDSQLANAMGYLTFVRWKQRGTDEEQPGQDAAPSTETAPALST